MPSRIRYGLLISITVIGLFLTSFVVSYAGSINYIYDDLGRLYQVFDPQGNVTTYYYDAVGNLLSITRSTGQKIVSIDPPAGLTNIPTNTLITVLFTRPVDGTTISGASFSLVESNTATPVQGTFSFDFDDRMVIFAPQSLLKPSTGYTLNITTSIKSADGIPLDQAFSGSFITAGSTDTIPPRVTTVPVDGATDVPINTNVVFIFSEPMNPASLNSSTIVVTNNGMPVPGNITLNQINTGATFVPFSNFLPNSLVSVTLSSRVTDIAGNRIVGSGGVGADFIISFTTASAPDNAPPEVLSITPADGATGIDRNTVVSITFDEPINPLTANAGIITISVNGIGRYGQLSLSNQNTVLIFTPDQALPTLSLVTVTLLPGISDMAGNSITSAFTSSFTTQGEPRLIIGYPGPTTLTLGDTINVEVANTGDSDTSSTYTVKLSDKNEVVIYQNTIFDTIQAGASKTYSFQIPNQAADNDYTLYAEVIDSRNIKTTNSFGIKIIGLNAALSTRTDKDIYLPTESITGISNILNGQFGIEGGSLKVSVNKTSQVTTGQFTHFLPKTGWWPFSGPYAVAVGSDQAVYVADTFNQRIQKFDSGGGFVAGWGSYGTGDGQFDTPKGIAIGSDGSVYVADTNNHRIQKFDSNGNFIAKWGGFGSGDGQLNSPEGVAVSPDGSVYVADTGNNRIQKFDSNWNFIAKWIYFFVELHFSQPSGIAAGLDGSVYVATSGYLIVKLDSDGNFIKFLGSYGTGNGQFYYVHGIAVSADGYVYVAEADDQMFNHRIQKLDSDGNFILKWGNVGDGDGEFWFPYGIGTGPDGSVYVADTWNSRIQKFDSSGNFVLKWGNVGNRDGEFAFPHGIATGPDGSVYVADTWNTRIQKFDSDGSFILKWGNVGGGDGEFNSPEGVAVGSDGSVYVVDSLNSSHIQKFDSSGNFIALWGSDGTGDGELDQPQGIAVGSDGSLYVADTWNSRIQKFDSSGNFIAKWGTEGTGDGEFSYPSGIATSPDGFVYVADTQNSRVQKFDGSGNFVTKWGVEGSDDGELLYPVGIAIGSDGSVYVVDTDNCRIQKFDSNGNFVMKWEGEAFSYPYGIAIGSDGSVYVADIGSSRILKMKMGATNILKTLNIAINQPANTTQDYTTDIGALNVTGELYLQATLVNSLGQTIAEANYSFNTSTDTTPPTGTITINAGAASTNSPNVTLTLSCNDDSGCSQMQFSNDNVTYSTPETYAATKAWTLATGDGTKTVYVKFKDTPGNWSSAYSNTILLDTTAPTTTASPTGGTYNLAQSVTLSCSDSTGSGCDKIYYTTDGTTPTTSSPVYSVAINISVTTTLKFFAKDLSGNSETVKNQTYTMDTTPPTGTIAINSGAASTNSPNVTLTLSCSDAQGCSQMQFSNDNVTYSTAEAYATSKAWALTSGDGTKSVYVKFKDTPGNWSTAYSNMILLDTTAPTTTASPAGGTYNSAQSVTLSCNDGTGSGCDKIYYTTDGTTPTTSSPVYSVPINISVTTTVKFFARDVAGNSEAAKSETYTISTNMVIVQLKDSAGNPLSGGVVQYYSGGWQAFGTTDANGQVSKQLSPASYTFSMTYAFGQQQKAQNIATNPTVVFQTTRVTVQLQDSTGALMDTGTVQYYAGGWQNIGSTSGGQVSKELLPASYTFSMTYAFGQQQKAQNIATNPTVVFQTTRVIVQLQDSTGALMDTGTVQYYAGGWQNIGSTSGGQVSKELLPASYTFSMTYAFGQQQKAQNIATNPTVVFQTTRVIVQLQESTGAFMDTGTVQYYSGGWRDIGSTSGGQVTKELLPLTYTFSMTYGFARQEKSQNIATNPVVVFQTTKVTIELRDSTGALMDPGTVQYYSGGWRDIGSTSGGQVTKELLPLTYTFSMTYGFARQEKSQNIATNPTVVFQTTKVVIELRDSTGALMDTGTVQYYSGGWRDIGSTSGGQATKELLPLTYTFSMTYGFARQEKSQNVATNPTVVFQTVQVHSDSGSCTNYYAGGWRTFTQDMQLLPVTYTFRFNDGTPDTSYTIITGTVNHIH